jgi:hypothetical protein
MILLLMLLLTGLFYYCKCFILKEEYYPLFSTINQCATNYHRYQSNLANPTQDTLPITLPNPNEGIIPVHPQTLEQQILCNLKYGYP